MQDRMIEEMEGDLVAIRELLTGKKDHAKMRDAIEAERRRTAAGNKRYTPPKRHRG